MSYTSKKQQIDILQSAIVAKGKLSPDVQKNINYKFRLDWNYYSNSMEGNTLTKEETRSVMVGNITVGGKPFKDIQEMKGHDEIISEILKIGKSEVRLSEKRIKDVHQAIIHEEDEEKKKYIGKWKTINNHIFNYKNEKFDFLDFHEVHDAMHELLNRTNADIDAIIQHKKNAKHPIDIALQFHLDYVKIHPFYDGNGRTARVFTNLILVSFGFPPFWMKDNEKDRYNQYIADIQGYGGSPNLFYEFCADLIMRSQQLVLDAIEGKDIQDADDLDKRIKLLEIELQDTTEEIQYRYTKDVFIKCYELWVSKLLTEMIPVIQKFNHLFTETNHCFTIRNSNINITFVNEPSYVIEDKIHTSIIENSNQLTFSNQEIEIGVSYGMFKKGGLKTFGCNYSINIKFDTVKFTILMDVFKDDNDKRNQQILFERLLHIEVTDDEIKEIGKQFGNTILSHIDYYTKKNGLRK